MSMTFPGTQVRKVPQPTKPVRAIALVSAQNKVVPGSEAFSLSDAHSGEIVWGTATRHLTLANLSVGWAVLGLCSIFDWTR